MAVSGPNLSVGKNIDDQHKIWFEKRTNSSKPEKSKGKGAHDTLLDLTSIPRSTSETKKLMENAIRN